MRPRCLTKTLVAELFLLPSVLFRILQKNSKLYVHLLTLTKAFKQGVTEILVLGGVGIVSLFRLKGKSDIGGLKVCVMDLEVPG